MAMIKEQAEKKRAGNENATKTSTLEAKQASPFKMEPATGQTVNGNAPDLAVTPAEVPKTSVHLSVTIDGKHTIVKDQIQVILESSAPTSFSLLFFFPIASEISQRGRCTRPTNFYPTLW